MPGTSVGRTPNSPRNSTGASGLGSHMSMCDGPPRIQRMMAGVLIVHLVHFLDGVEEADDERGAERFARLDRPAAKLLNHAHVAALVAPRFGDDGRVEGHAGKPGAVLAGLRVADVIGADEP